MSKKNEVVKDHDDVNTDAVLLIEKNGEHYLVEEQYLFQLLELANSFNCTIHRVHVIKGKKQISDLKTLCSNMNSRDYICRAKFLVGESVFPPKKKSLIKEKVYLAPNETQQLLGQDTMGVVRAYIAQRLNSGQAVSTQSIRQHFQSMGVEISPRRLTYAFSGVRTNLSNSGATITRVGVGTYRASNTNSDPSTESIPGMIVNGSLPRRNIIANQSPARPGTRGHAYSIRREHYLARMHDHIAQNTQSSSGQELRNLQTSLRQAHEAARRDERLSSQDDI